MNKMSKKREPLQKPPSKPHSSVKRPSGQIDVRKAAEAVCTFCASGRGLCMGPDWFGEDGHFQHFFPGKKGRPNRWVRCLADEIWKLVEAQHGKA